MNGHLNLISLYVLPLLGWTLCAFCQGKGRTGVTLLLLIAIFSLSFGTSREIFAIIWVIGTCTAVLALYYFKHYRTQILKSYGLCIIASAVTLCIYWPYFGLYSLCTYHENRCCLVNRRILLEQHSSHAY